MRSLYPASLRNITARQKKFYRRQAREKYRARFIMAATSWHDFKEMARVMLAA